MTLEREMSHLLMHSFLQSPHHLFSSLVLSTCGGFCLFPLVYSTHASCMKLDKPNAWPKPAQMLSLNAKEYPQAILYFHSSL